ncbi:hypothetical protein ACD589_15180 [Rhizobium sp. 814_E9_N1_1]|uniref:hypothetical protein n=1 Tax=Rhizobium sp. 814_E9_N1_1 TaxID=3276276 RepID=UPI003F232728
MTNKMRVSGAAIVVVAAAIVVPVVFGAPAEFTDRHGGDAWRNLIYDFQTLITGVLAVVAALGTILQMRRSDALQDRRHRENRRDLRRGDELVVTRLRAFLPSALRSHSVTLRAYVNSQNPFGRAIEWHHAKFEVEHFQDELQDFRVTSCFHLLPQGIFESLEDCKRRVETILRVARKRAEIDLSHPDASDMDVMYEEIAIYEMGFLETKAVRLADLIDDWAMDFISDPERAHLRYLTP